VRVRFVHSKGVIGSSKDAGSCSAPLVSVGAGVDTTSIASTADNLRRDGATVIFVTMTGQRCARTRGSRCWRCDWARHWRCDRERRRDAPEGRPRRDYPGAAPVRGDHAAISVRICSGSSSTMPSVCQSPRNSLPCPGVVLSPVIAADLADFHLFRYGFTMFRE